MRIESKDKELEVYVMTKGDGLHIFTKDSGRKVIWIEIREK